MSTNPDRSHWHFIRCWLPVCFFFCILSCPAIPADPDKNIPSCGFQQAPEESYQAALKEVASLVRSMSEPVDAQGRPTTYVLTEKPEFTFRMPTREEIIYTRDHAAGLRDGWEQGINFVTIYKDGVFEHSSIPTVSQLTICGPGHYTETVETPAYLAGYKTGLAKAHKLVKEAERDLDALNLKIIEYKTRTSIHCDRKHNEKNVVLPQSYYTLKLLYELFNGLAFESKREQ